MTTAARTRITQQDLKIYPSERLTDNDDGGGMPLGTPLQGKANELFNPISSIARVNGAFYTRLEYMGVLRADNEPLIGAFAAITEPPKDDTVSYLLFKATRFGEMRAEILKRIEAYSVGTIESRMTLLSTQSKNSKIIQAYQREGEPLPLVGDVYCLRQDKKGYPLAEQYVQVTRVKSETRKFYNKVTNKEFSRVVVQMELSSKLEVDFIGADYPDESYIDNPCKIRETGIADAAQYYGVKPLAAAIAKDSLKIRLPSLMEKLVPTNQISTRLLDLTAAGQRQTLFDSARTGLDGIISLAINKSHGAGQITSLYLGNAITPGSIIIDGSSTSISDKAGIINLGATPIGSVDYARGQILINAPTFSGYLGNIRFRPAAAALKVADTARINVTINNRSDSYTFNINPPPAVGTLQVSYRSQGRWYDLMDDGSGVLRGASAAHGSGSVSFVTGSGAVTLGELPDVGSAILLSWGTRANYFNRSGGAASAKMLLQLANDADPASVTLAWHTDADKTAHSDAAGNITGDWTGMFDAATRQIRIDTGANFKHPAGVLDVTVTYNKGDKTHIEQKIPLPDSDGNITLLLGDKPIRPNTLRLGYKLRVADNQNVYPDAPYNAIRTLHDDGNGKLLDDSGTEAGTIDYSARKAVIRAAASIALPQPQYKIMDMGGGYYGLAPRLLFNGYKYVPVQATIDMTANLDAWFYDTSPSSQVTENLTSGLLEIDLLPSYAETVLPGSVNFRWGGKAYFDKQGNLYGDLNVQTGDAVLSGTVDYQSGKAMLKKWQWTDGAAPVISALATSIDGNPVDAVTFRTPSSPIRPGSLQLRATATDGTLVSARADASGALTSSNLQGKVDAEYGVVDVRFGQMVDVTDTIKKEPWYDPNAVTNNKVWQPKHVFAETITYNADAYTYLPIDTSVVKIDTVRLPQDGRVPIFRRGDSILIGNRQTQNIGSAFTGGQTIQLSRGDLDRICITDADGKPVNAALWDYDLDAGSITFKSALDLSPYKMPLSVMHAQEERNRILETDIDGTLTLIFPTKRAYPIEGTYVSSLLIGGDLQVRVSVPFTQRNWNNVWQETPNGDQLLNKLNLKDYPMLLTDDGAITDRWLIKFVSSSQFELYSEALGFVGKYDTLTDLAPMNPATGKPYFTIPRQAFGNQAPWVAQDVIRFDTWGTLMAVWVLCAVQPSSQVFEGEDGFSQCLFGDTTEITV